MRLSRITSLSIALLLAAEAAFSTSPRQTGDFVAPGAPGAKPAWTNGNKQGVGTSNTLESKVWFTLGEGVLQEVYYPTVDKANTRSLEFVVTDNRTFAELESRDTTHEIEVVRPDSLAFRQVNTSKSGRYRLTKTCITDPERDTVLINVSFTPLKRERLRLYVLYDPAINNSGFHDAGYSEGGSLVATDGSTASALVSSTGFTRASSGYQGTSDGWSDLKDDFKLDHAYQRAVDGNVMQAAELPASAAAQPFTLALGFGTRGPLARAAAEGSLKQGFARTLDHYNTGWRNYLARLKTVEAKYRDQYQMAAMMLKAHEDKTYRGAGVASLTVPWGDAADASEPNVGGYHNVWSRDLYQVATAFLAMGDKEAADRALDYLFKVQQKPDGSFPQNSWLDGRPFWNSVQMDEVAYPLILAHELGRTDAETFEKHVKPAANYLIKHGPATPQERWEEESGYSPSTIAAEIAGLVSAAEIASKNRDEASALLWRAAADQWVRKVDSWTVTTSGPYGDRYFLRLSQTGEPDSGRRLEINNGGGSFDEREIVDAGFLELVRLGIRRADDPVIKRSLEVVDQKIKVQTPNGPAWYRYNHDGYGEKPDGRGYDGTGKGRLWVLLTGERGEYALRAGADGRPYLDAMQRMATKGRMLPEQVWDRAESPLPHLKFGQGTGSATPLAWTNAQFIRLALAIQERRPQAAPAPVVARYQKQGAGPSATARASLAGPAEVVALRPGQVVEVAGFVGGEQAVLFAGGEVRELKPGPFKLPVTVSEEGVRVAVAAIGADATTAFDSITISPARVSAEAGPPDWSDRKLGDQLMNGLSPRVTGSWVTFVYRGEAKAVEVVGEMTDWNRRGLMMKPLAGTNVKYLSLQFPDDARIEYKYVVDEKWSLDELNPNRIDNGVGGENSFFQMPGYKATELTRRRAATARGRIERFDLPIEGTDRRREVRVYLPPGYAEASARYPTVYLCDGIEYLERARAGEIADNLIADRRLRPVVMVFVAPNDRTKEYWMNDAYVDFLVGRLVPMIDSRYRTDARADARAIGGASLGGLISTYAGLKHPEVFGNVIGQSSAYQVDSGKILTLYASSERRPLKFYLMTGRFEGLVEGNRKMKQILEARGYKLAYLEVNAGHNWTSWADTLADALVFTFPASGPR